MEKKTIRCAIYTRKSSKEGLEQDFNSLDAQREACESYIKSQQHEGWVLIDKQYNDGGFSGGTLERPALKELFQDIEDGKVDTVVVYKIDRLTRSLMDFSKIVELFDKKSTTFVSIIQQFNTTTSMGRLTLNILLSFAQFEREVTGERIVKAISRSHYWNNLILSAKVKCNTDIQKMENFNSLAYIRKIIDLRFLCPDIVEAILAGTQPKDLSICKLFEVKTLSWQEQKKILNF
ncbi:MAG TPA: hypothetical protein DDW90_11605 [Cyanobacteria bacterium UBA9971]|nr:hypothetical protein [Cyanobacteria bacterium UBA9971]